MESTCTPFADTRPYPGVWWYKDWQVSAIADFDIILIHNFRLPVFFVMAGFFAALLHTRRGATQFATNRAKSGNELFRKAVKARLAPLFFAIPAFASLSVMHFGLLDTPHSFTPVLRIVVAYAVFFGVGWLLYGNRDLLADLNRR